MSNAKTGKTAVICAGGGMRSAYSAGFLYAMATMLGITSPDIMIGSSGSAGNTLYFVSKQYDSLKYVWEELLPSRRFICFARIWRIMNIDYLVDTIFKREQPLDMPTFDASSIEWYISVTDAKDGSTHYLGRQQADPYELLRASKALPLLYRRIVRIGDRSYFDGELGSTIDDRINIAVARGATRVLVIAYGRSTFLRHPILQKLCLHTIVPGARAAVLRGFNDHSVIVPRPHVDVFCVIPERLPAASTTRKAWRLRATFEQGAADALSLEQKLRTLFA